MWTEMMESEVTVLAGRARQLASAAREFVSFADSEPTLAARAGVEVLALEARGILGNGAAQRAAQGMPESGDVETLVRLEGVVTLAGARMEGLEAAMEAAEGEGGFQRLAGIIGLASGAVGLIKSFV